MSSSAENKTCAICLWSLETGKGNAIFTAECSHSFHFACIGNNVTHGNHLCPVCRATWKDLPFAIPNYNPNTILPTPQPRPLLQTRPPPLSEQEPLLFSDDEPLPVSDHTLSPSPALLQDVTIKAIPERAAIAASEPVTDFTVLLSIRAPPLSEDARKSQRAPIDLVTVLDVSGSMHGSKLALLKRAVNFVIDNMGPTDRISVVSFSSQARRILPLRRMTENGRENAKRAVNSLRACGSTNIVEGLKKGVQVLEERREKNPVASIIFLSDGRDTCNHNTQVPMYSNGQRQPPQYLNLLPASIRPVNLGAASDGQEQIFPVHAFGFGTDHDPLAMHAISDASTGTFSFIESYEMVQDAFASCLGGLLSVVTQELRVMMRSASNGVEIKLIPSGRYASEIVNEGAQGTVNIGDLYADEEKQFLINLSIPVLPTIDDESEGKTSLLDITCSYRDVLSKEMVHIECDLVEIRRPKIPTPGDMAVNIEVDRQWNRLSAAESIAAAQQMAETGDLTSARAILSNRRSSLMASPAGQAGDGLCMWLESEMKETEERMGSLHMYERTGRAYALSNMSSHGSQRATTSGSVRARASFNAYSTPQMASMVNKSQQLSKIEDVEDVNSNQV